MTIEAVAPNTFPKLLAHHATQRGERTAIRQKSRGIWHTLTWSQLADDVRALAVALAERGVQRSQHVALLGGNRPRLYAAMCAVQWLGAIAVPLYQDARAEEIRAPLRSADVTLVFAEDQEQVDKVLAVLPECPSVRCIVYDHDRGMRHYRQPQLVSHAALLQRGREGAAARRDWLQAELERGSGADPACLLFTSGTTGPAKGVVLTHASLIDRGHAAAAIENLSDADVALAYLPPAWIAQHFFAYVQPMVVGCSICCPESSDTMLADMREVGPTRFLATPRVLEALLAQVFIRIENTGRVKRALYRRCMAVAQRVGHRLLAGESVPLGSRIAYALGNLLIYGPLRDVLGLSRVRVAHTTGEPIGHDLLMFYRSIGMNLKQLYGSTETGAIVALQRNGEVRPGTVGSVAQGVEVRITPQREILVRSPGLFKEYHGNADATSSTRVDGWYRTGDVGYLGDDGHLRVIDHMQDIGALTDGTPFAPKVLENRVRFSPYVREAVAFGHGRDRVCVLVDIDPGTVGNWADKRSISYAGHADLASRDEVYALIAEGLAAVNGELARDPSLAAAQIHRFVILRKGLDADDGVLTRTGKLRRNVIEQRWQPLLDAMYGGLGSARLEAANGAIDAVDAPAAVELRIGDAKVFAPAAPKRVA